LSPEGALETTGVVVVVGDEMEGARTRMLNPTSEDSPDEETALAVKEVSGETLVGTPWMRQDLESWIRPSGSAGLVPQESIEPPRLRNTISEETFFSKRYRF
jgi:hypothetical protein